MVKSAILSIKAAAVSENGTKNCARVIKGTESDTTGITKKFTKGAATEKVPERGALTTRRIQFTATETQISDMKSDFGNTFQILRTVATQSALIKKLIESELPGIRKAVAARDVKKMKTGCGKVPKIIKKSKKSIKTSERKVGTEAPVIKK